MRQRRIESLSVAALLHSLTTIGRPRGCRSRRSPIGSGAHPRRSRPTSTTHLMLTKDLRIARRSDRFSALAGHARTSMCKRLLGSRCDGTWPAFPTTRFVREGSRTRQHRREFVAASLTPAETCLAKCSRRVRPVVSCLPAGNLQCTIDWWRLLRPYRGRASGVAGPCQARRSEPGRPHRELAPQPRYAGRRDVDLPRLTGADRRPPKRVQSADAEGRLPSTRLVAPVASLRFRPRAVSNARRSPEVDVLPGFPYLDRSVEVSLNSTTEELHRPVAGHRRSPWHCRRPCAPSRRTTPSSEGRRRSTSASVGPPRTYRAPPSPSMRL